MIVPAETDHALKEYPLETTALIAYFTPSSRLIDSPSGTEVPLTVTFDTPVAYTTVTE